MAFATLVSQQQSKKSTDYTDTKAPTEANYETISADLGDDVNSLFSAVNNLMNRNGASFPDGTTEAQSWWNDIDVPSTLETGTQRGINALNNALHALEKKRRLRFVKLLVDVTVPAAVQASETLTTTAIPGNNETVTIGGQTYTYKTTLTPAANEVLIGASQATAMENLRRAINNDGVADTNYGAGTVANAFVTATDTATTVVVTAIVAGTAGNGIAVTETLGNGSWGNATLQNGAGDLVILDTGEIPTGSGGTQAVGAVTTLGTVVAHSNTFGTEATLDEVAGLHALAPKNLIEIVNGSTGDPILSSGGKRIWALMQSEDNTDGAAITNAAGSSSVQLVFVQANSTNDDLEISDGADIGGATINYCYKERVRNEDLNEQDYLNSAAVDIGAGSASVTLDAAIDNQVGAATQTQDIDINISDDVSWAFRDSTGAVDILRVSPAAAGDEVEFNVASFDVNHTVDANFNRGIDVDTGTQTITIGGDAGSGGITSGGAMSLSTSAGDLSLAAGDELNLTDSYRAGSSWSLAAGISLADSSTEWSDFETSMAALTGGSGEVSILRGIALAADAGGVDLTTVTATFTANVAEDTDVSGPANDNNLDTNLGDLSGGTFVTAVKVYLNGLRLISAANNGAGGDVYPGTSLANGQLRFQGATESGWELVVDHFVP